MAALAEGARTVCILELDAVMIENFAVVWSFPHFHTTHAVGPNGIGILHPVHHIQVVDVLLDDVIAASPNEVIPVAHLVFHFCQFSAGRFLEVSALLHPWSGS